MNLLVGLLLATLLGTVAFILIIGHFIELVDFDLKKLTNKRVNIIYGLGLLMFLLGFVTFVLALEKALG